MRQIPPSQLSQPALATTLRALGVLIILAAAMPAVDTPPRPADPQQVASFLAKVSAGDKGITTVRMPFVQEKHLAIMDEPLVSKGVIEIDRGRGGVRWEFIGKSVMIFAHGQIHRWSADGKQESIPNDPNLKPFQDQMQAFLSGDWSKLQDAFILTPDAGGAPVLTMTPKSPQLAKYLTSIELRFRSDFTAPKQMRMLAAGGDETIYRFDDPQPNIAIPADRFEKP